MLVEIVRVVTYEVRQGSVTCYDLSIYKQHNLK